MTQKVVVNWNSGKWAGRQAGGFIAPGIGYGEIVCSPDQQWIRFYPSEVSSRWKVNDPIASEN